jgi:hypothetical protein
VARLEQLKEQLRSVVSAASTVNHEDLGALQSASEQLHQACEDLRHQWRGNAVAEGIPEASWMPMYEAEVATATAAISRINASIRKRQSLRKLEAASRAANRSLADVDQVLQEGDIHEATELHTELVERRRKLNAAALEADKQEDDEQMDKLDHSIRKLAVMRRNTVNDNVGSSPFPQAAYNSPPPLRRQEAFQLPQVDQQGYNLTN